MESAIRTRTRPPHMDIPPVARGWHNKRVTGIGVTVKYGMDE
jgi:hypothetical protein